jgi:hypothetical protein
MFYAYVERFDVMGERWNILGWDGEVNKALVVVLPVFKTAPSLKRQPSVKTLVYACSHQQDLTWPWVPVFPRLQNNTTIKFIQLKLA